MKNLFAFISSTSLAGLSTNLLTKSELYKAEQIIPPKTETKLLKDQETHNLKITSFTKYTLDSGFYLKTNEDFDKMSFLERIRFYRTVQHYSSEIKRNSKVLKQLIYQIDDYILFNKSLTVNISNDLVSLLINKGKILNESLNKLKTKSNDYLINYIFEEPIHVLLETYSQLGLLQSKSKFINNDNIKNMLSVIDEIHSTSKNDLVKFDCQKAIENINSTSNLSHNLINVNKNKSSSLSKSKDINIVFINGLNSTPMKSWRMKYEGEGFYCKTKPSFITCHFKDLLNYFFNLNFNTQQSIVQPIKQSSLPYDYHNIESEDSQEEVSGIQLKFKRLFRFRYLQYNKLWINKLLENRANKKNKENYFIAKIESKIFERDLKGIPNSNLFELSERLKYSIEKANILSKPTIFVCHSMGGLILKNMIVQGLSTENIKGTIFFSSPHKGSNVFYEIQDYLSFKLTNYLRMADHTISEHGLYDEEVRKSLNIKQTSTACNEICFNSEDYFNQLKESFLSKNIPHCAINEGDQSYVYEVSKFFWIVKPESALLDENDYQSKNQLHQQLNYVIQGKKHFDVQKMKDENDQSYRSFLDKLTEYENY